MYHDDEQYTKSMFIGLAWNQRLRKASPSLVHQVAGRFGAKAEYEFLASGSFNCCYRLKRLHSILRFLTFGKTAFRYEKTNDECMIMTYISRHTSIPVPKLLVVESFDLGPYMVLTFVDGTRLSDHLKEVAVPEAPIALQPDIDIALLTRAYRNMAALLIEISGCKFTPNGAVSQDEAGNWCLTKRPITLNMNQLVSCGNFPPENATSTGLYNCKRIFYRISRDAHNSSSKSTQ